MNGVKRSEGHFLSGDKETEIAYYMLEPDCPAWAVVQLCHGMAEYFLRYQEFGEFLCEHGVAVCGCDHKGHGKSGGAKGDFGKGNGLKVLVEDQKLLAELIKKKYRHLPYILFGHSMGSFVIRLFMAEYHGIADGAVICGTAGPGTHAGTGILLAKFLEHFGNKPSKLLNSMAFSGYNKHTGSKLPSSWLTRDEEVVKRYLADPLCGFPFTVSGYRQLFEAIKEVNTEEWIEKVDKSLPILLISGEEDPVGGYGKGPRAVYEWLEEAEVSSIAIKMYPGARHELINELCKEEVYKDVLDFVKQVAEGVREARMQKY